MPEKFDPRILSIWEQEQQLEQRRKPKQPLSREQYQEAAKKQKQEIAVHFSNADSKQKPLQQESDYDLDTPPRIIPPKTIKDNLSMHFDPPHTVEAAKVSTAGATPQSAGPPSTNKGGGCRRSINVPNN